MEFMLYQEEKNTKKLIKKTISKNDKYYIEIQVKEGGRNYEGGDGVLRF